MTPLRSRWAFLWVIVMIGGPVLMMAAGVSLSEAVAFPVAILSPCVVAAWRLIR